jgi:hypothetical protein
MIPNVSVIHHRQNPLDSTNVMQMLPTFMVTKRNGTGVTCNAVSQVVANTRTETDILT